jgi:hypothetical protein
VKGPEEFDYERMVCEALHYFEFAKHLLVSTLLLEDELLGHGLDGEEGASVFLAGKINFLCKATSTNHFDLVEVFHGALCVFRSLGGFLVLCENDFLVELLALGISSVVDFLFRLFLFVFGLL